MAACYAGFPTQLRRQCALSRGERWVAPVGWNSRGKAAVMASSSAGSSRRMVSLQEWMPDSRPLRLWTVLPSGEAGPVGFLELRRLASGGAWVGMIETSLGDDA